MHRHTLGEALLPFQFLLLVSRVSSLRKIFLRVHPIFESASFPLVFSRSVHTDFNLLLFTKDYPPFCFGASLVSWTMQTLIRMLLNSRQGLQSYLVCLQYVQMNGDVSVFYSIYTKGDNLFDWMKPFEDGFTL